MSLLANIERPSVSPGLGKLGTLSFLSLGLQGIQNAASDMPFPHDDDKMLIGSLPLLPCSDCLP